MRRPLGSSASWSAIGRVAVSRSAVGRSDARTCAVGRLVAARRGGTICSVSTHSKSGSEWVLVRSLEEVVRAASDRPLLPPHAPPPALPPAPPRVPFAAPPPAPFPNSIRRRSEFESRGSRFWRRERARSRSARHSLRASRLQSGPRGSPCEGFVSASLARRQSRRWQLVCLNTR